MNRREYVHFTDVLGCCSREVGNGRGSSLHSELHCGHWDQRRRENSRGVTGERNEYDQNKRRQQSSETNRQEAEELFVDFQNGACPLQVVCVWWPVVFS